MNGQHKKILTFFIFFIITLILIFNFFTSKNNSQINAKLIEDVTAKAVQESTILSIFIVCQDNEIVSLSGTIKFSKTCAYKLITHIEKLTPGWLIDTVIFSTIYPERWTEPQPSLVEIGPKRIAFFELDTPNATSGPYNLYFNLTQQQLNNLNPEKISLFLYETEWIELNTTIINNDSYPISFKSILPHLSKFAIGEKIPIIPETPEEAIIPEKIIKRKTGCFEKWNCTEWADCSINNCSNSTNCSTQYTSTRTCVNTGTCIREDKTELKECEYPITIEEPEISEEMPLPVKENKLWVLLIFALIFFITNKLFCTCKKEETI